MFFHNVVDVDVVMSFMSNENCKGDTRKYCSKVINPRKLMAYQTKFVHETKFHFNNPSNSIKFNQKD